MIDDMDVEEAAIANIIMYEKSECEYCKKNHIPRSTLQGYKKKLLAHLRKELKATVNTDYKFFPELAECTAGSFFFLKYLTITTATTLYQKSVQNGVCIPPFVVKS